MTIKAPDSSFRDDSRGVSELIGFILMFGILIILLSMHQAQFVPQENSEIEFQHFQEVRNDMVEVRSSISTAGQADVPQYPTVKLGTNYPVRLFAVNPPPPAGSLETSKEYHIWINDSDVASESVSTRFLVYRNGYNEMDIGPIWYEHSVLYLDERENNGKIAVFEDQNIITGNNSARVTALQNDFSVSSTGEVTVELYPTETTSVNLDEMEGNITLKIPTRLNESVYWNDSIGDMNSNGEWEYHGTEPHPEEGIWWLNLTVDADSLKFNTVGINSAPTGQGSASQGVGLGDGDGTNGGGGASDPPGNVAYNDANNNGYYDPGEATYSKANLEDGFDNKSVNLVIPSDVGTLDPNGNEIKANSITLRTDISGEVKLEAKGTIDVTGQSITTTRDDIEIMAGKSGSGELIATNATMDTKQDITLGSSGDMYIDQATVSAGNGKEATASLNDEDATLFVGGATISDQDDTLVYKPGKANINGTPNPGSNVKSD